jgi:hypothetical protein
VPARRYVARLPGGCHERRPRCRVSFARSATRRCPLWHERFLHTLETGPAGGLRPPSGPAATDGHRAYQRTPHVGGMETPGCTTWGPPARPRPRPRPRLTPPSHLEWMRHTLLRGRRGLAHRAAAPGPLTGASSRMASFAAIWAYQPRTPPVGRRQASKTSVGPRAWAVRRRGREFMRKALAARGGSDPASWAVLYAGAHPEVEVSSTVQP